MNQLAAQVSLYPLGQEDLSPVIDQVLDVFRRYDLHMDIGPMSTILSGGEEALFAALREATTEACASGKMVMTVTLSNACAVN